MRSNLLERFLAEEASAYVRGLLENAIAEFEAGAGPSEKRFEFNCFEVTVDRVNETVMLEDVLDATSSGELKLSIPEFRAALRR